LFVASLPPLHKDPFDRILLSQAMSEGVPLLTVDAALPRYHDSVIFAG
jgi:PIN domain nuclease of toxin-antitoxin system